MTAIAVTADHAFGLMAIWLKNVEVTITNRNAILCSAKDPASVAVGAIAIADAASAGYSATAVVDDR